jgi:hypothetical protein
MPGVRWSRAPGPIGTPQKSVGIVNGASKHHLKSSRSAAGKPTGGSVKRYHPLRARGKNVHPVVAIARELIGLMWAMAQDVPLTP